MLWLININYKLKKVFTFDISIVHASKSMRITSSILLLQMMDDYKISCQIKGACTKFDYILVVDFVGNSENPLLIFLPHRMKAFIMNFCL